MNKKIYSVRLSGPVVARLERAIDRASDPYAPSATAILQRGVELALAEIDRRAECLRPPVDHEA